MVIFGDYVEKNDYADDYGDTADDNINDVVHIFSLLKAISYIDHQHLCHWSYLLPLP